MNPLEQHPLAKMLPVLSDAEILDLAADIKAQGLLERIVLYQGMILDGFNRYTACLHEGIKPEFEEYTDDDPVGFVVSKNLRRRHLATWQRRQIAETLLQLRPQASDNIIAKEVGLSHSTVAAIRRETAAPPEAAFPSQPSLLTDRQLEDGGDPEPGSEAALPLSDSQPAQRYETGLTKAGMPRKARGRKPNRERKADTARVPKEIKPKRLVDPRDDWIMKGSEMWKSDTAEFLTIITNMVHSGTGPIIQRCSERQRKDCVDKFARALGLEFDNLRMIRQLPF